MYYSSSCWQHDCYGSLGQHCPWDLQAAVLQPLAVQPSQCCEGALGAIQLVASYQWSCAIQRLRPLDHRDAPLDKFIVLVMFHCIHLRSVSHAS